MVYQIPVPGIIGAKFEPSTSVIKTKANDALRAATRDRIMNAIRDQIRAVLDTLDQNQETVDLIHQLSGLMIEVQRRIALADDSTMFTPPTRPGMPNMNGDYTYGAGYPSVSLGGGVETFGAKLIRELIEIVPAVLQKQHETPTALVRAIAEAKEAGLTEIAKTLEQKLIGTSSITPTLSGQDIEHVPDDDDLDH